MFPLQNLELTINSIYQDLLNNIRRDGRTRDISTEFLSMTEAHMKVFFAYKLIKSYKLIPLIYKEDKCEYSSVHYRSLGNLLYQRSDLYLAWQYYNLALMYAPLSSLSYSLAVSNRSAVLAALEKYKECLEDINMVFTLFYPNSIRDKLIRRKKQCEDALQQASEDEIHRDKLDDEHKDELFSFKSTPHVKYIDASSKLTVKYTPEMGRHVVATQDIEVGEVLVKERPFVRVLLKNQIMLTCAYCFSRKCNLYPCPYCCMTMYCSRDCVSQAWDEYHFYECPFMASLLNNQFTKLELLALRATIMAKTKHRTWQETFSTAEKVESCSNPENLGCKEMDGNNLIFSSEYYESVHSLATNIEKRDVSDLFQKAVSAAILLHYLAVKNFVESRDPDLQIRIKKFTADTLMRHLMTAPTNMHGLTANVQDQDYNYVDEYNIGSGAYPFLSLINHSCAPNVVRYTTLGGSETTLFALRPIKKGQQILDNYGYAEMLRDEEEMATQWIDEIEPDERAVRVAMAACGTPTKKAHHAVHNREDRQSILRSQYKFACICEACTDDWPVYHALNTVPDLPLAIVQMKNKYLNGNVIEDLQKGKKVCALKVFKPLCELATALEPFIPCKEAAECQEAMKQCLAILSGVLPLGFSEFAEFEIPAPKNPGSPISSRFYAGAGAFHLLDDVFGI